MNEYSKTTLDKSMELNKQCLDEISKLNNTISIYEKLTKNQDDIIQRQEKLIVEAKYIIQDLVKKLETKETL